MEEKKGSKMEEKESNRFGKGRQNPRRKTKRGSEIKDKERNGSERERKGITG